MLGAGTLGLAGLETSNFCKWLSSDGERHGGGIRGWGIQGRQQLTYVHGGVHREEHARGTAGCGEEGRGSWKGGTEPRRVRWGQGGERQDLVQAHCLGQGPHGLGAKTEGGLGF